MASISKFPEQELVIEWKNDGPTLQDIRILLECIPEIAGPPVVEMFKLLRDKSEFHVGRFEYLRALELHWKCEQRGLTARLSD